MDLFKLMMKFHRPVKRKVIDKTSPVPAPIGAGTNDVGIDPIGNEEFVPITKKEYGFDWEKRKGLDVDEYRPEG